MPSAPPQRWNGREYGWGAVLIGSGLPEIACRHFGIHGGIWLGLGQASILVGLAIVAARLCPIKNLAGFILAIAALSFGWRVAVPLMEASSVFHSATQSLNWGGQFFLSRAIRTVGAGLLIFTLIGSSIGPRELFLRVGNWHAPVQPEPFLRFRRSVPWTRFAAVLLVTFGVVLPLFLFFTFHPQLGRMHILVPLLPWALATAALNAANEEFQCRSVLLARLRNVLPIKEAILLTAALFALDHYFGQPSGWAGVLMAGIAGWVWAKSMIETRGFTCAFVSHFVQDMVIFGFLALSVAP